MTHDAPPISLLRRHVECASSVRTVALELLWGCNLRCSYCYIGTAKNWDAPSIPRLEQIAAVIDAILKSPIEDIYFVGGEPLAHPQFEQICDLVGQHDSLRRGVCSNGTLFTQAKIE